MPFQPCKVGNQSDLYQTLNRRSTTQQKKEKPVQSNVQQRPSTTLVFNGNKKLGEKRVNGLINVLASSFIRSDDLLVAPNTFRSGKIDKSIAYQNPSDYDQLKERSNEKRHDNDQPGFGMLISENKDISNHQQKINNNNQRYLRNNKNNYIYNNKQIEYYDSDFNVTVDNELNNFEFEEQVELTDQYAYIVVPIKISKNKKLPDLNSVKNDNNKKKNKKVSKQPKNFEGLIL